MATRSIRRGPRSKIDSSLAILGPAANRFATNGNQFTGNVSTESDERRPDRRDDESGRRPQGPDDDGEHTPARPEDDERQPTYPDDDGERRIPHRDAPSDVGRMRKGAANKAPSSPGIVTSRCTC